MAAVVVTAAAEIREAAALAVRPVVRSLVQDRAVQRKLLVSPLCPTPVRLV